MYHANINKSRNGKINIKQSRLENENYQEQRGALHNKRIIPPRRQPSQVCTHQITENMKSQS